MFVILPLETASLGISCLSVSIDFLSVPLAASPVTGLISKATFAYPNFSDSAFPIG